MPIGDSEKMPDNVSINTHNKIDNSLCGTPIKTEKNYSLIELVITDNMKADKYNLVHGGFTFSLADYAAMLAINHPNVVLLSSNVSFLKPVIVDNKLVAEAKVIEDMGKKKNVHVDVKCEDEIVFKGDFLCFVPEKHVLEK